MRYLPLLMAILVAVGCSKPVEVPEAEAGHSDDESGHVVELDEEQVRLAGIETRPASVQLMRASIKVPGVVTSTARGRAVVTPPVPGRVVSIAVSLGDTVKQGERLAVIESPELAQSWAGIADAERQRDAARASLNEAEAEVQLAKAKEAAARGNLARQRQLAHAGAFSQAPLQQAQSNLSDAQSELLSIQKEQASHLGVVRSLESLYQDGIVSKAEFDAAKLELQQDEIKLDRARARVDAAKAALEREKNIAARDLLSAKEVQAAEAEVRSSALEVASAKVRVGSARASVASAEGLISNARSVYHSNTAGGSASVGQVSLVAPISGNITHLDITKGQAVDRTTALMEVENLTSVWVTANVPERDSIKARKGSRVRVTVPSLGDREFSGIVQIVTDRVDPKTRSIAVQCLVTETFGLLKPEMFANVHLAVGAGNEALAVPSEAVVTEGETNFLFIKDDHGFERVEVTLGKRSEGLVEVKSGIKEGDLVVVKGAFVLASELKKGELKGHEH